MVDLRIVELSIATGVDVCDPPEVQAGTGCGVPNCDSVATDYWLPSVCALREAGIEVDWVPVCTKHDFELNKFTINFFFEEKYDDVLASYKRMIGL